MARRSLRDAAAGVAAQRADSIREDVVVEGQVEEARAGDLDGREASQVGGRGDLLGELARRASEPLREAMTPFAW